MQRRRLRVVSSSDEEDEHHHQPPPAPPLHQQIDDLEDDVMIDDIDTDFQTVTLNSANPTPNTTGSTTNRSNTTSSNGASIERILLDISDDDAENVTANSSSDSNPTYFEVSNSPVNGALEALGLRLKKEWLESCLSGLQATAPGFQMMDDSAKAKLCFKQFLVSDMNYCGAGVLPRDVHAMHLVDLKGPFVLQVDEIVNISCPLRGRYQNAASGIKRCLKLSMTDGVQRVFGMEYRPIKDLEALAPAGMKIAICNVNVRHGLLMLVPEVLEVLGGSVEELDAARHRLIAEINKPPRGKRNRDGIVPSLATRATLAAWPAITNVDPGNVDRVTGAHTTPPQTSGPGNAPSFPVNDQHRQASEAQRNVNNSEPNTSSAHRARERVEIQNRDLPAGPPSQTSDQGYSFDNSANNRPRPVFAVPPSRNNAECFRFSAQRPENSASVSGNSDQPVNDRHRQSFAAQSTVGNSCDNSANNRPRPVFAVPPGRNNEEHFTFSAQRPEKSASVSGNSDQPVYDRHRQAFAAQSTVNNPEPRTPSTTQPRERVETPKSNDVPASTPSQASGQGNSVTSANSRPRPEIADPLRDIVEPFVFSSQRPEKSASVSDNSYQSVTEAMSSGQAMGQGVSANKVHREEFTSTPLVADKISEPNLSSVVDMDVEEISMINELEHAFLFSKDKEVPFTYLASLSLKLAANEDKGSVVRGKIKCFITGVKSFQYQDRDTYELIAYVDDGSLISEILIHHDVIQNAVPYPIQEVSHAKTATDPRSMQIKNKMKQFQLFLTTFEGIMHVEMSASSPMPVATKLDTGCPESDASLLLARLKSYSFTNKPNHSYFNPINISP